MLHFSNGNITRWYILKNSSSWSFRVTDGTLAQSSLNLRIWKASAISPAHLHTHACIYADSSCYVKVWFAFLFSYLFTYTATSSEVIERETKYTIERQNVSIAQSLQYAQSGLICTNKTVG